MTKSTRGGKRPGSAYSFMRAAFRRNAGLPLHDPIEWSADDD